MNEQIRHLAVLAGMVKFPPSIETELQKNILFGDNHIEQFAKLIVQECFYCVEIMEKIAHASNADIPPDYDRQTYLKTLEAVTGLLKAHFGVEE